ncbi:hypothetical protein [Olsenella phocaeensis]|uniref:hypothetical protein n=1 Tax=Olsenella phocaeensis TaxID=1852385 RepID=UPI000931A838|nr:hypothetical protein [Olsenella phocaeensis]
MAVSDAQRRADAKYKRESTKTAVARFYPADADLWEWLCAQPNKAGYIKRLIREDMERRSG